MSNVICLRHAGEAHWTDSCNCEPSIREMALPLAVFSDNSLTAFREDVCLFLATQIKKIIDGRKSDDYSVPNHFAIGRGIFMQSLYSKIASVAKLNEHEDAALKLALGLQEAAQ